MKNRNILMITLMLVFTISFIGFASAASSSWFNMTLSSDSNFTTSASNVTTIISVAAVYNVTNVTCFYNVSGGPSYPTLNATWLGSSINDSTGDTSFTITGTIASESTRKTNITCVMFNDSNSAGLLALAGGNNTISSMNVTIDGTAPTVTIYTDMNRVAVMTSVLETWTAADSGSKIMNYSIITTTPDSSRCPTIISASGTSVSTVSDKDALTQNEIGCSGTYNITATAWDFSGNKALTSILFTAYSSGLSKTGSNTQGGTTNPSAPGFSIVAGRIFGTDDQGKINTDIVAIFIVIALLFLLSKKNKR